MNLDLIELALEREPVEVADTAEKTESAEVEKKPVRKRGNRAKVAVDDAAALEAKITYFNKYTMIAGVRCGDVGHQIPVKRTYRIGETVMLRMEDGVASIE